VPGQRPGQALEKAEEVCAELGRIEDELPTLTDGSKHNNLWKAIRPKGKFGRGLAIGLPVVIAAIIIAIAMRPPRGPVSQAQRPVPGWKNSLIVLPFKHLNVGAGQEYLWPTVTDRIIRNLGKARELKVISYQTALQYLDSEPAAADLMKKLDVANVLRGTITSEKEGLDIRVELRNLKSESVLFSRAYPAKTEKDIYGILDEITRTVAGVLGVTLDERRDSGNKSRVSTDPGAQRYYRYGLHFQDEYFQKEQASDFASAVSSYQKAIEFDPGFALVYWRLGIIFEVRYNRDKQAKDLDEMFRYLKEAYDRDPNLAEANLGMGWVYFNREDHDRAFPFFRRAYELDVNNAEVNYHIGSFLRSLGLYEQARIHYTRALALDPYPGDYTAWQQVLADCYSQLGQAKDAADVLSKAMEGNPDYHLRLDLAVCLLKLGDYAEAEKEIAEARRQTEDPAKTRRHEALLYAAQGRKEPSLELMKNEDNKANQVAVSVFALLGLKDKAIEGIRLGEKDFQRYRWYPYSYLVLKNNPFFDSLRLEPGFQVIFEKEKGLYEERLRKFGGL